jgi:hypothetical protein
MSKANTMRPMTCDVYFKDESVFVLSWTPDEKNSIMRSLREPVFTLDPAPTSSALGRAVRQALDLSGTPTSETFRNYHANSRRSEEVLRAAGIRSWSRLTSTSRLVSVKDDGARVRAEAWGGTQATCGRDPEEIGRLMLELRPLCSLSEPLSPARPGSSYRHQSPNPASDGGTPQTFGYKFRWIVVDTTDASAVVSALGLKDVQPATWDIDPYGHAGVFVSPSVLGWTYILGLYVEPHYPQFVPLLESLSERFGEAQYFTTHRVVGLEAWAKAVQGRIVRGYGWISERGEVLMDMGELTPEEQELGFARFINSQTVGGEWDELEFPQEDDVMHIAGKWSINPQELDAYDSQGPGFLGKEP